MANVNEPRVTHVKAEAARRNQAFDLLRLVFAAMVLLSHAPELTDGNTSREILSRLTHFRFGFGGLGVDGFFLLSGFLIVQSWQHDPNLVNYLRKRLLRIVPGYAVAVLLSILAVGLLAPAIPHFFSHLGLHFFASIVALSSPITPPVLKGEPYPFINGSMWTIAYEFRCYLIVALAGLCGVLRRPIIWLAMTVALLVAMGSPSITQHLSWPASYWMLLIGVTVATLRLTAIYFVGGCFYLFRKYIPFRPLVGLVAFAGLVSAWIFRSFPLEIAVAVLGGYLMFYLAQSPFVSRFRIKKFPDISYGVYLYGWPVEALWIYYRHGSPWVTFLVAVVFSTVLGALSWHFIERPMLKLKRKSTAPVPADVTMDLASV